MRWGDSPRTFSPPVGGQGSALDRPSSPCPAELGRRSSKQGFGAGSEAWGAVVACGQWQPLPPLLSRFVFLLDQGLDIYVWRGAQATLSSTTKAR